MQSTDSNSDKPAQDLFLLGSILLLILAHPFLDGRSGAEECWPC